MILWMPSNRKPKLSLKKAKGLHVYKCVFPTCLNFFTSRSNQSVKYCQNHTHYPTSKTTRSTLLLASLSLVCLLCLLSLPNAQAAESYKGKAVGVIIEKSCLLSEKCLKYKDIVTLDNSNQKYSGEFIPNGNDIKRKNVSFPNPLGFYRFDNDFRVFVDPPQAAKVKLPLIEIRTKLDQFFIQGQSKITELKINNETKATDKVRTFSHTRYVDSTCTNAIITAKNWKTVLPDTINYLRNGCDPSQTKINTLTYEVTPLVKHDISTSYKWKYEKWQAEIIKNCLKQRNSCQESNQPTRGGL